VGHELLPQRPIAHQQEVEAGVFRCQAGQRVDQMNLALDGHQAADGSKDDGVFRDAELLPHGGPHSPGGLEGGEVDTAVDR
jgi:hypothetical protein